LKYKEGTKAGKRFIFHKATSTVMIYLDDRETGNNFWSIHIASLSKGRETQAGKHRPGNIFLTFLIK
jgi:hypothetical protein